MKPVIIGDPLRSASRPARMAEAGPAMPPTQPTDPNPTDTEVLISEPVARQALPRVGADSTAEQIWAVAVDDVNLPAEDRRGLIEDLATSGLSDPALSPADRLGMVMRRLAILEELSADPIDATNAAAFAATYRELGNTYDRMLEAQAQAEALQLQAELEAAQQQMPPEELPPNP